MFPAHWISMQHCTWRILSQNPDLACPKPSIPYLCQRYAWPYSSLTPTLIEGIPLSFHIKNETHRCSNTLFMVLVMGKAEGLSWGPAAWLSSSPPAPAVLFPQAAVSSLCTRAIQVCCAVNEAQHHALLSQQGHLGAAGTRHTVSSAPCWRCKCPSPAVPGDCRNAAKNKDLPLSFAIYPLNQKLHSG